MGDEKHRISLIYDQLLIDKSIQKQMKNHLQHKYPRKRIGFKMNNSIQKILRSKDSKYNIY